VRSSRAGRAREALVGTLVLKTRVQARGSRARRIAARAIVAAMTQHISRGFAGRRREIGDPARIPPGQYLTRDFPVLSAGPTPHTPLDEWSFTVHGAVEPALSWTWEELLALPSETPTVDIHCVTKWSKLDTT
jgi:DMSO/TMAO reductase YedYZ molybdopterin-dependent catalytic subunit